MREHKPWVYSSEEDILPWSKIDAEAWLRGLVGLAHVLAGSHAFFRFGLIFVKVL